MKTIHYTILCAALCITGSLFFFYHDSWFILTVPLFQNDEKVSLHQKNISYKTVTLYAWHNDKYKAETTQIIYSDNHAQNITLLLNSWLMFLDDEHVTNKETQVISVCLSPSKQEAFICLNQYPFEKDWSTYQKLHWVESMLKTIKDNKIPITAVRLLVHHHPLQDDHLHFDISWPISGYLVQ